MVISALVILQKTQKENKQTRQPPVTYGQWLISANHTTDQYKIFRENLYFMYTAAYQIACCWLKVEVHLTFDTAFHRILNTIVDICERTLCYKMLL